MLRHPIRLGLAAAIAFGCAPLAAAPGDQAVKPLPSSAPLADDRERVRTTIMPAHGLFDGDQLTEEGRRQITQLIADARELNVEVALIVPTGSWKIGGSGKDDRDLTPARLDSVRRYLGERGVDPKRIFVESRIDKRIKEATLAVQVVGRPAID